MNKKTIQREQLTAIQICLLLFIGAIVAHGAAFMSTSFCPDEYFRLRLNDYLVEAGRLPIGNEPEIQIANWGFSYAYRPYLTSIIGAIFMKLAIFFGTPESCISLAARISSVLSVVFLSFFSFSLGNELFRNKMAATVYGIIISFLPQIVFLGMYLNNDVFSLCCVSMILYYLVCGEKYNWNMHDCVMLAVSFALALLSYYSIYGWVLFSGVAFLILVIKNREISKNDKIIRILSVIIIAFVLAGWFFIRNAVIYHGDFLGLKTESESVALFEQQTGVKPPFTSPKEKGQTFTEFWKENDCFWVKRSIQSMVGVFGYLEYFLSDNMYICYYSATIVWLIMFVIGCLRKKPNRILCISLMVVVASSALTFIFSMLQSFYRDWQPQGRYIVTCIFLFAVCIAYSIDSFALNDKSGERSNLTILSARVVACLGTITSWGYMFLFMKAYCYHLLPLILHG